MTDIAPGHGPAAAPDGTADRRAILAWCFYDWANSAYPTVISTFIFGTYVTKAVAASEAAGTSAWGWTMGLSGIAVAILSPILGAIADRTGRRKPWLLGATYLTVVLAALLWFTEPDPSDLWWGLLFAALSTITFEVGMVFYNAMLPEIAPPRWIGRVSGWAWGLGYVGGLACLAISLVVLVQPDPPPFGLDPGAQEPVRATSLLVALWVGVFALPTILLVPETGRGGIGLLSAAREGISTLMGTLRHLRHTPDVVRFLVARMLYIDGINTVFTFGGIYAAGTFGMSFDQVIQFGIAMNVSAGAGAAAMAVLDDRLGPRWTISAGLLGMLACGVPLLLVESVALFWAFGLAMSLFFGPVQSASRSYMARIAPPHLRSEYFGLYALSGRVTAFLGPTILGTVVAATDSQRVGMSTVVVFMLAGLVLLRFVPEAPKVPVRDAGAGAVT